MAKPQGILVQVKRGKMHIRQMGEGEKKIVLLPGWGCPLPTVEFAPLMRKLSQKHTVCIIELFGYGFSDSTDTPRTNENYVEEIRETLKMAGLKPPFVLMPYSVSGIYAEYYAAKYPNEIDGLILLDVSTTIESTAKEWKYTEEMIKDMYDELEASEASGKSHEELVKEDLMGQGHTIAEIESMYEEAIAEFLEHGYTLEEIHELDKVPNHERTLLVQDIALSKNIQEVVGMLIPKHIPTLVFRSGLAELNDEERVEHENYRNEHMSRLGETTKHVVIEGSNHLNIAYHQDYLDIISKEVDEFLKLHQN